MNLLKGKSFRNNITDLRTTAPQRGAFKGYQQSFRNRNTNQSNSNFNQHNKNITKSHLNQNPSLDEKSNNKTFKKNNLNASLDKNNSFSKYQPTQGNHQPIQSNQPNQYYENSISFDRINNYPSFVHQQQNYHMQPNPSPYNQNYSQNYNSFNTPLHNSSIYRNLQAPFNYGHYQLTNSNIFPHNITQKPTNYFNSFSQASNYGNYYQNNISQPNYIQNTQNNQRQFINEQKNILDTSYPSENYGKCHQINNQQINSNIQNNTQRFQQESANFEITDKKETKALDKKLNQRYIQMSSIEKRKQNNVNKKNKTYVSNSSLVKDYSPIKELTFLQSNKKIRENQHFNNKLKQKNMDSQKVSKVDVIIDNEFQSDIKYHTNDKNKTLEKKNKAKVKRNYNGLKKRLGKQLKQKIIKIRQRHMVLIINNQRRIKQRRVVTQKNQVAGKQLFSGVYLDKKKKQQEQQEIYQQEWINKKMRWNGDDILNIFSNNRLRMQNQANKIRNKDKLQHKSNKNSNNKYYNKVKLEQQ